MAITFTITVDTEAEAARLTALLSAPEAPAKGDLTPMTPTADAPAPRLTALTKATRKAFVAALPEADAARYAHASCGALAALVAKGTIAVPAGFRVGDGYAAKADGHGIKRSRKGAYSLRQAS